MDQTKKNLLILNLSLESPHRTSAGTMVLIEKIPLGEFDLLEATLQHSVTGISSLQQLFS